MLLTGERCSLCHDSGYVIVEETGDFGIYGVPKTVAVAKKCPNCNGGHDVHVEKVRKRANIPSSFYDAAYSDFKWDAYMDDKGQIVDLTKQKQFIDSFVEDYEKWEAQGLGVYIWSKIRGTGKTYLASCICNELMRKYYMVTKFVSCSDLIAMDRSPKDNYEKNPIDVLCDCKLLVLDDLGQKKGGEEWMDDILFRIIDSRYQNKLVTIITSNIKLKELRLDDRVSDRLNKMCQPIPLPDYSFRQKEGNQKKIDFFKEMGLM